MHIHYTSNLDTTYEYMLCCTRTLLCLLWVWHYMAHGRCAHCEWTEDERRVLVGLPRREYLEDDRDALFQCLLQLVDILFSYPSYLRLIWTIHSLRPRYSLTTSLFFYCLNFSHDPITFFVLLFYVTSNSLNFYSRGIYYSILY